MNQEKLVAANNIKDLIDNSTEHLEEFKARYSPTAKEESRYTFIHFTAMADCLPENFFETYMANVRNKITELTKEFIEL